MSHVAARQELRALVAAIKPLPAAQADFADQESRLKSRVKIALPSAYPYQPALVSMADQIKAQGPEGRMRVSVVATGIEAERAEQPKQATLGFVTSLTTAKLVPEPAEECQVADAETAIEQLTQYQPAEDRPEDGQPADNKTVAAAPFAGDGANSEEAGEQSLETGGGVDGEKGGGQGKYGVRYIVRDRELETRIYKIAAIQSARIRNEPHAEKLKVFANLEEAKAAAGAIFSRIIYEKEEKGRSTYLIKARRANLMYETDTKVTNYFV
jgi:hypothetical protein